MPRLFTALELPQAATDRLVVLQSAVFAGASLVEWDQFHLTLHFIGEVDTAEAGRIGEALARVEAEPFAVSLHGVGYFGSGAGSRCLWAGVGDSPELLRLHARVGAALRGLGVKLEARTYRPHVTLAWLDEETPLADVQDFLRGEADFTVPSCPLTRWGLYSSVPAGDGPRYNRLQTYPLRATSS
jgi:2'-5' RNA ligase